MAKKKVKAKVAEPVVEQSVVVAVAEPTTCGHPGPSVMHGWCFACFSTNMSALNAADFPEDPKANVQAKLVRGVILTKMHESKKYLTKHGEEARAIMRQNLTEYADLHLRAARNAATDGDAKPAQWAMERISIPGMGPVADPPAAPDGGGGGVRVYIGVKVGGVPQIEGEVVDAKK